MKLRLAPVLILAALPLFAAAPMKKSTNQIERLPNVSRPGTAWSVKVDDQPLLFTGQIFATDLSRDVRGQVDEMIDALGAVITQAGGSLQRIVRLNVYVSDDDAISAVEAALAARFAAAPPAVTIVRSPLARAGARVGCDAVAAVGRRSDKIETVREGVIMPAGAKAFISGQAKRGKDFTDSVAQTMAALHDTLTHLGRSKADVVQVKAFINPMSSHAAARQEIEQTYTGGAVPAIVVTEWLASAPTEIELIIAGGARQTAADDPISFHWLPGMPVSPYFSRMTVIGAGSPLIFIGNIDGGADAGPRDQWLRVFEKLAGVLRDSGSSFRHMAKATYYLADPAARESLGEIRSVFYDPARPPAASAVDVQSIGRPGLAAALDMIAVPTKRLAAPPAPK